MTKQVQLSDKAYKFLKANKRDDESFSEVVLRLGKPRRDLMGLVGKAYFGSAEGLASFRKVDREVERRRDARRRRLLRGGR